MQPIKVDIGADSRIYLERADIDGAARFLVQRYGHEAASEAVANLDWMLSRSDAKGARKLDARFAGDSENLLERVRRN